MDQFEKYLDKAYKFLTYRPRSEKEVRDNLKKMKAPQDIIESVITFLKGKKYLNDEEFAKWWIEQRIKFKQKSKKVLRIELLQKGIEKELIIKLIEETEEKPIRDIDQAKEIVEKKIKKYKGLPKAEVYHKLGAYLARQGFDWETIRSSIDAVLKLEYNQ